MSDKYGKIAQVIGPVVDVIFEGEDNILPPIYTALKIDREDGSMLILEVEQHIGEDTVRCVAMESTDGLRRGPAGFTIGGKFVTSIVPHMHGLPGRAVNNYT